MSEWWTYRPQDLLLFSPRVYWRLFELTNVAFWPLHLATLALGVVMILLTLNRPKGSGRFTALALAMVWAFVAWTFLWNRYASINWAMVYVAPVFGLQAVMLAVAAVPHAGVIFEWKDLAGRSGLMLALAGLFYPLLAPFFDRGWISVEVFGLAPDPTAVVTLGFLLAGRGAFAVLLAVIPLLWLLISGLTLHTLGDPQSGILFAIVAAGIIANALRRVRSPREEGRR